MRHHTKDKGDLGVGYVIADLISKGIQVALPISEHLPFDCIAIAEDGQLCRLSIKYRISKFGRVEVRLRSSWADKNGSHMKAHKKNDYDATAIYCPSQGACYYVKSSEVEKSTIILRTDPPKNNQEYGVKLAGLYSDPRRLFDSQKLR